MCETVEWSLIKREGKIYKKRKEMVGMDWFKCVMIMMMVWVLSCGEAVSAAKFEELYRSSWAMDHCVNEGEVTKLKLDSFSGTFIKQTHLSVLFLLFLFVGSSRLMMFDWFFQELGLNQEANTCLVKSLSRLSSLRVTLLEPSLLSTYGTNPSLALLLRPRLIVMSQILKYCNFIP